MTTNNLTRSHEDATTERFQKDPELASEFLAAILIDGDKDESLYARALVAKAFPVADSLSKS